jgi:hypothetical protein
MQVAVKIDFIDVGLISLNFFSRVCRQSVACFYKATVNPMANMHIGCKDDINGFHILIACKV